MSTHSVVGTKFENTILYLLGHSPTRPGLTHLLKMLYFADSQHYRRELESITGAEYVALPNGPVINDYKQLFNDLVHRGILDAREVSIGALIPKTEYLPLADADESVFTPSELATLNAVIEEFGRATGTALSERTHRDGPWTFAYEATKPGHPIPYALFRWLDNMPDESDLELARSVASRPELAEKIAHLNAQPVA